MTIYLLIGLIMLALILIVSWNSEKFNRIVSEYGLFLSILSLTIIGLFWPVLIMLFITKLVKEKS